MNSGVSVLVVDADPMTLTTIALMLKSRGHLVVESDTVDKALNVLMGIHFDVVIANVKLLDQDFLHFAGEAKLLNPKIKAVIATGTATAKIVVSQLGMDEFLQKPFSIQQLENAIQRSMAT